MVWNGRKTTGVMVAFALSVTFAAPTAAYADGTDTPADGGVQTLSSSYGIEDLKGVKGFWEDFDTLQGNFSDFHFLEDFDYRSSGPYYFPWGTNGNTHVGVYGIPTGKGWTMWMESSDILPSGQKCPTSCATSYAQSPDGQFTMHWDFIQESQPAADVDDLSGITFMVAGRRLPFSQDVTDYTVDGDVVISGLPSGWTAKVSNGSGYGSVFFIDKDGISSRSYFFSGGNIYLQGQEPAEPSEPSGDGTLPLYRLYNPNSGEHLYTMNATEYNHLVSIGWRGENLAFQVLDKDGTEGYPVYRLYHLSGSRRHHLTASAAERDHLVANGWRYEGVAFRYDDSMATVYRGYSKSQDDHLWTLSRHELDVAVGNGWRDEGIAFGQGASN